MMAIIATCRVEKNRFNKNKIRCPHPRSLRALSKPTRKRKHYVSGLNTDIEYGRSRKRPTRQLPDG